MAEINRWKGSEFIRPHAITIDHDDNLWLVDDDANVITKCDRDGNRVRSGSKLCATLGTSLANVYLFGFACAANDDSA